MTRDEIKSEIIRIFREQFEIENPELDEDLRDAYEFDSIDAIDLLREIEIMLRSELTRAEKKRAMEIRTMNQILDYVEALSSTRAKGQKLSINTKP
jgi:acyl carrier protein